MFDTKTLTTTQVADLVSSYNDRKATLTSIAKELGCSVPTVSRLLKKNGVQMRGKGRPKGSKTVNRKPKVVATVSTPTVVQASTPEAVQTDTEKPAPTPAVTNDDFTTFQQKVMSFTKVTA